MASDIGPMRASIRLEALDISVPPSKIMQTISEWDGRYGPITHVYAISAISNHLDDEKPCDLVRVNLQLDTLFILEGRVGHYRGNG